MNDPIYKEQVRTMMKQIKQLAVDMQELKEMMKAFAQPLIVPEVVEKKK